MRWKYIAGWTDYRRGGSAGIELEGQQVIHETVVVAGGGGGLDIGGGGDGLCLCPAPVLLHAQVSRCANRRTS